MMKAPLPPAARSRRTTNTIQNARVPCLDVVSVGWLPVVVPPLAPVVLEAAGVLPPRGVAELEGTGVLPAEGVDPTVVVLVETGVGWEPPPGIGGLVNGKSVVVTA